MFDMIFLPTKIIVKRSKITFFYQGDKSLDIDIQIMRKWKFIFVRIFYSMKKYKLWKLFLYSNIMLF
jgi:hypothetical protein